jgi:hypothetical protein
MPVREAIGGMTSQHNKQAKAAWVGHRTFVTPDTVC